ncbi:MAG: DNA recombination protein RmuC [Bacteroidales bacterium]|nr:DNA recombination protein RmuC [Bacteroidales bacterium]
MELAYLIFGLFVGGVLGYLYASRQVAVLKSNMALQSKHADEVRAEDLRNFQQRMKELEAEQEKNKAAEQKLLTAQFENLANQILKSNSSEFKEMSANSLKVLLDPLNDKIKDFKEKVEKCYGDEAKERFSLQQEINKLIQENQKISVDANNLANALKGESKTQGDWGEMILSDILQKSGLKEGEQYFPQNTIRDENGELLKSENEQLMRPDMVVVYPGERKIIIDSKVSLTAYVDYVNAEDKNMEKQKLKEHLASIRKHIDELSAKDYSKYDVKTPEFVMMFIPNESAYYVAVKSDPNLWNYAYQKKVVLMNQTNLITALRLALDLWRRDAQEKNIMEIVKVGSDLYDKFVLFTENFSKVGDSLDKARQCYDDAFGQLSTGKGNLIGRAERLRGLGISPKKALPKTESED